MSRPDRSRSLVFFRNFFSFSFIASVSVQFLERLRPIMTVRFLSYCLFFIYKTENRKTATIRRNNQPCDAAKSGPRHERNDEICLLRAHWAVIHPKLPAVLIKWWPLEDCLLNRLVGNCPSPALQAQDG